MTAPVRITDGMPADALSRVVVMAGPFEVRREIALADPMTVAEALIAHDLADADLRFRLPSVVALSNNPAEAPFELRSSWHVRTIAPGETMTVTAVPGGGSSSGGGKSVIGAIAMIALAVAAPWAAGLAFTAGTLAHSVATLAIMTAGSLLINAILPKPAEPPKSGEQVYTVNAANNQATPLEPILELFGRLRYPPRFAARPYSEFRGNDQYLFQLFQVSAGHAEIEKIEVSNTEMWNEDTGISASFPDTEIEIIHPGDEVTLFPANVVTAPEVGGIQMGGPGDAMLGPFAVNAAGTTIRRIALDFFWPQGIHYADPESGNRYTTFITIRADYREIDDDGDPVGAWTQLFSETVRGLTRTPQRRTFRGTAPTPGRYEVRTYATAGGNLLPSSPSGQNRPLWTGLKGYLTGFKTPADCTLLAVRIKANDHLSQMSSSQFFVTAQRHLPTWDADEQDWTDPVATSSPAWAAAHVLKTVGIADGLVDLDTLATLAATWGTREDEFNGLIDRSWTVEELVRTILAVGRAQPVRLGGRIGFIRDEPKQIRRTSYGPWNITRGSAWRDYVLFDEEKPSHCIVEYIDRTDWLPAEVPGVIAAVGEHLAQRVEKFGITEHDHAAREAIYEAANNFYRRSFFGFRTEWTGKLLTRGEPVIYHDPMMEGLQAAILRGLDGQEVTLDRDIDVDTSGDLHVIITDRYGKEWGPCLVDEVTGARTLTLDASDRTVVEADQEPLEDVLPGDRMMEAKVTICEVDLRPINGLVVAAVPDENHVDVTLVVDDPRVYTADETEVIPSPWAPPLLPPPVPDRPVIQGLNASIDNSVAELHLLAGWLPAPGALTYEAEISFDGGNSWLPAFEGRATSFSKPIDPWGVEGADIGTDPDGVAVELPEVMVRARGIGAYPGAWVEVGPLHVPEPALADGVVTREAMNAALDALLKQLDIGDQASIWRQIEDIRYQLDAEVAQALVGISSTVDIQSNRIVTQIGEETANSRALITTLQQTTADEFSAIAQDIQTLDSEVGDNSAAITTLQQTTADEFSAIVDSLSGLLVETPQGMAQGTVRFRAVSAPAGVAASYMIDVRASTGDGWSVSGMVLDAGVTSLGGASRIRFRADSFQIASSHTQDSLRVFEVDTIANQIVLRGDVKIIGNSLVVDDGTSELPIFSVSGGKVRAQNFTVGELEIESDAALIARSGGNAGGVLVTGSNSGWEAILSSTITVNDNIEFIDIRTSLKYSIFVRGTPQSLVWRGRVRLQIVVDGQVFHTVVGNHQRNQANGFSELDQIIETVAWLPRSELASAGLSSGTFPVVIRFRAEHINGIDTTVRWGSEDTGSDAPEPARAIISIPKRRI